jgi:hypothetical protein
VVSLSTENHNTRRKDQAGKGKARTSSTNRENPEGDNLRPQGLGDLEKVRSLILKFSLFDGIKKRLRKTLLEPSARTAPRTRNSESQVTTYLKERLEKESHRNSTRCQVISPSRNITGQDLPRRTTPPPGTITRDWWERVDMVHPDSSAPSG